MLFVSRRPKIRTWASLIPKFLLLPLNFPLRIDSSNFRNKTMKAYYLPFLLLVPVCKWVVQLTKTVSGGSSTGLKCCSPIWVPIDVLYLFSLHHSNHLLNTPCAKHYDEEHVGKSMPLISAQCRVRGWNVNRSFLSNVISPS